MALPMPGNINPQPQSTPDAPAVPGGLKSPPPIPGPPSGAGEAPPLNQSFAQGNTNTLSAPVEDEDAVVTIPGHGQVDSSPPFDVDGAEEAQFSAPPTAQVPPQQQAAGLPPVPGQAPAASSVPAVPAQSHDMAAARSGGMMAALAEEGFDGLEVSFGTFPMVRLQNDSFSLNDGTSLGNTFLCLMHGSRQKWLIKCEDTNTAEEFVYSYDRETTISGKPLRDIFAIWANKGYDKPVWKDYLDVTAQLVDHNTRELGQMVMLSIPKTSVPRITGYFVTLMGHGLKPNQAVTQVYPGQIVTNAKKPFHPWAFKKYANANQFIAN